MEMDAVIDSTGRYRYSLSRSWGAGGSVGFIMLNPSKADDRQNDPTIRRCIRFAQAWGYGALEVVNLFAYRTAYPRELQQVADPTGVENDRCLLAAAQRAEILILAWGNWGGLMGRDRTVLTLLAPYQSKLYCLGCNKFGQPRHLLYVKGTVRPKPYEPLLHP
ncbi:MAG: DUF1643 domain-containing protein [Leptolyngbyaceae cyanobacterium MO_188.B28]|nr:DUF1643 domain-containing protein [Leptolyngbyaceae cyanobacterium MO_188.B28]